MRYSYLSILALCLAGCVDTSKKSSNDGTKSSGSVVEYPTRHQEEASSLSGFAMLNSRLIPSKSTDSKEPAPDLRSYLNLVMQAKDLDEKRTRDLRMLENAVQLVPGGVELTGPAAFSYANPGELTIYTRGYPFAAHGLDWSEVTVVVGYKESERESSDVEIVLHTLNPPKLMNETAADGLSLVDGKDSRDAAPDQRCDRLLASKVSPDGEGDITCQNAGDLLSGSDLFVSLSVETTDNPVEIIPGQGDSLADFINFTQVEGESIFGCETDCFVAAENPDLFEEDKPTPALTQMLKDATPQDLDTTLSQRIYIKSQLDLAEINAQFDPKKSQIYGVKNDGFTDINSWATTVYNDHLKTHLSSEHLSKKAYSLSSQLDAPEEADKQQTLELNQWVVGSLSAYAKAGQKTTGLSGEGLEYFFKEEDTWRITDAARSELSPQYLGFRLHPEAAEPAKNPPFVAVISGIEEGDFEADYRLLLGRSGEPGDEMLRYFDSGSLTLNCQECTEDDEAWYLSYTPSQVSLEEGDAVEVDYKVGRLQGSYRMRARDFRTMTGTFEVRGENK